MNRTHDAFESLAGAIALGEATADERSRFATHARQCASCRQDLAADPATAIAAIRSAAAAETWRPVIRDGVSAAIQQRRRGRMRSIGTAIASAALFSVALDLGFSSGALGSLAARFAPAASDPSPVAFASGDANAEATKAFAPERAAFVVAAPHRRRVVSHVHARTARAPLATTSDDTRLPAVDDLFGGLANDPHAEASSPHVAAAPTPDAASGSSALGGG